MTTEASPLCGSIVALILEANRWTDAYAQVVMGSVGEINFVADIQAQTDGSEECFHTAPWIENAVDVIGAETIDRTRERVEGRGPTVEAKLIEAAFRGHEETHWAADLKFGSKKSVENAHI